MGGWVDLGTRGGVWSASCTYALSPGGGAWGKPPVPIGYKVE
jgi:hypothetical protein